MKTIKWLFTVLTAVVLAGCSESKEELTEPQVTGIPFQTEKDGRWSMLSPTGEIIFEEEFEKQPMLAYEDRFFAEEDNGLYALYTAEDSPEKLADGFSYCHHFINGKAVVSKPGEYIQIIDTEGKVIRVLDEVRGKEIDRVYVEDDGMLRFETTDHYWGLLDADGDLLLEPEYGVMWYQDGTLLTNPMEERQFYYRHIPENMTDHIMNTQGEETGTIKGHKHITTKILTGGQYLACYLANQDVKKSFGLFDLEGKTVIKPSKKINNITLSRNEEFIFQKGDSYGLMNTSGDVILAPEYDKLWFWGDDLMLAGEEDDDEIIGTLIDKEGKPAGNEEFLMDHAIDFPRLGNKHALVQLADGNWVLANRDGSIVKDLPNMVNTSTWTRVEDYVQNCHVEPDHIADELNITAEGVDGLTVYMTPQQFVNAKQEPLTDWVYEKAREQDVQGKVMEEFLETNPITLTYYYSHYDATDSEKDINLDKNIDGLICYITPYFRKGMVKEVGDDYEFINKPIDNIECYIPNRGKAKGHLQRLYTALDKKIRPFGRVLAESNGYLCIFTNKVLIELRKDTNGKAVSLYYTPVYAGEEPNTNYIRSQAQDRANVVEDCPLVVEE